MLSSLKVVAVNIFFGYTASLSSYSPKLHSPRNRTFVVFGRLGLGLGLKVESVAFY